jgi:hypothetical protein
MMMLLEVLFDVGALADRHACADGRRQARFLRSPAKRSEAERLLHIVDKLMVDLIEDMGGNVIRSGLWT